MTLSRAIAWGGLTVGVLDGLDAVVYFGLRGVSPIRIFQGIAAGILGRDSFQGRLRSAGLGVVLHFLIATTIVTVMCLAARRFPLLLRRPLLTGCVYGIGVWLMMNFVVIPLSAIGSRSLTAPTVINGLLIHLVGVGIPAVLFARAAGKERQAA